MPSAVGATAPELSGGEQDEERAGERASHAAAARPDKKKRKRRYRLPPGMTREEAKRLYKEGKLKLDKRRPEDADDGDDDGDDPDD